MQKILIVEGLCRWNGYIKKMLDEEGYCILTTRTLLAPDSLLNDFQPDLVLIDLGGQPDSGWDLFRQLKTEDVRLPVLVYHVVNAKDVEEMKSVVAEALRESRIRYLKNCSFKNSGHNNIEEEYPVVIAEKVWPWEYEALFCSPMEHGGAPLEFV